MLEKMMPYINENTDLCVMDGAMASALQSLEQRCPHISAVKCAAHSVALIFKDLSSKPWWSQVLKSGKELANFMRKHHT